jgi:tRNA threonylcarbamoyladenosine biosynthesis protein TsaE
MEAVSPVTFVCESPEAMNAVAAGILALFPGKRVFALSGPMGSGKTTLVKSFCKALAVQDSASSPTFTIVNEYLSGTGEPVYHFDFYRINSVAEAFDLGFDDYLYSGCYCFIEWPEKVGELLPGNQVTISISVSDSSRTLTASI